MQALGLIKEQSNSKDLALRLLSTQVCFADVIREYIYEPRSSGCSLSWVPEYVISALRHKIFPNPKTVVAPNTEEQGRRTKLTPDFTINSRLRHEIMNWHIVYTFWMGDEAPLKMMGPVDLFMCDRVSPPSSRASESVAWTRALLDEEDMDGLLYANLPKLKLGPNEAIFGVVRTICATPCLSGCSCLGVGFFPDNVRCDA